MVFGTNVHDRKSEIDLSLKPKRFTFPCEAVPYVLATADAFVIVVAGLIAGEGYHWFIGTEFPSPFVYASVGLLASFIHILRLSGSGYYDFQSSAKPHVELVEITVAWVTTTLLLAFFAFLLKIGISFSRGSFVVFAGMAWIGLLGTRKASKALLQRAIAKGAIGRRNIVLIGDNTELAFLEAKDLLAIFGAADVNRFALVSEKNFAYQRERDTRLLDRVAEFVKRHSSSEILLALPWNDEGRLDFIRDNLKSLPVSVRLLPDARVRNLTNFSSSARQSVLSVEVQRAPLSFTEQGIKRIMDLVISLSALLLLMPIMLLTAIAIKLDGPGPVIFRQNRKGFNGQQFVMYKFRTMTVQENGAEIVQATPNDPRVTRIGKLLRAASIDELPQLVNVVSGKMSIVGPRPHALAHDTYFATILGDYASRHHVKPGITGWAQCNGSRGATPSLGHIADRVKMDLWYINNWSLWLDIRILMKTFFEVLRRRNAF